MQASDYALTTQQLNFFKTFGYLKVANVLHDQIETICNAFEKLFADCEQEVIHWKHDAHYNKQRDVLMQIIEREPVLVALLDNPKINGIFSSILGDEYIYRASEGNIFSGDTYWHSDLYNALFKYQHIKMAFYLDPIDSQSGAFRAIPGSHLFGDEYANLLEQNIWQHEENYALKKEHVPSQTIPTNPGDLVIFDYRLKHATINSGARRRMFTICASEPFADEDIGELAKLVSELKGLSDCVYQPALLDNAPASRMRHLKQCLDADAYAKEHNMNQ